MVPAAGDNRELPPLSTVGWFSPLPLLGYAGDNVVPDVCPLVLVAARVPLAVLHGDEQSDSTLATIPGGPAGVGTAEPWPTCGVRELPPHVGQSD
jgi:hypothetical protein